jgi:hypothetical protein
MTIPTRQNEKSCASHSHTLAAIDSLATGSYQIQHLVKSPIGFSRLAFQWFSPRSARVVDQDMESILENLGNVVCKFFAAFSIADIRGHILAVQRRRRFFAHLFVATGQQDIRTRIDKAFGNHQSNATGTSRDQDIFAGDRKQRRRRSHDGIEVVA